MISKKKNSYTQKNALIDLYQLSHPYHRSLIIGFTFLLLSSICTMCFPYFINILVKSIAQDNFPILSKIKNHLPINWRNIHHMHFIGFFLCLILILQIIFSWLKVYWLTKTSEKILSHIRICLHQKMLKLPMIFFDSQRLGDLHSRVSADVSMLYSLFSGTFPELLRQIITIAITFLFLVCSFYQLCFIFLICFPFMYVAMKYFGSIIKQKNLIIQQYLGQSNVILEESLQTITTVKSFTNEAYETKKYQKTIQKILTFASTYAFWRAMFISTIIFFAFGAMIGVIWYGTWLVENNAIDMGKLFSFVFYIIFLVGSLMGIGSSMAEIQKAGASAERIMDILKAKEEQILQQHTHTKNIPIFQGHIVFDKVSLTYPTRSCQKSLQNLSFEILPGEKVAFIGASGAGKSSIVQLLLGLYPIQQGNIFIDNKTIQTYDLYTIRHNIGWVPQETLLLGGSIQENIAYGNIYATQADIIQAAKQANALDFILSFPKGFQTIVGERGVQLSGGQRQRIAIARVILKNPTILILDEATSALDQQNAQKIYAITSKLMYQKTVIMITHQLATIRHMDKIFVLDKGQLIAEGNHATLMQSNNIYQKLLSKNNTP